MAHGGKRENAGRKTKADEVKLIEQMDRYVTPDQFWEKVSELVKGKDMHAIRLWANYRFGMPNQSIDHTTKGERITQPQITVMDKDDANAIKKFYGTDK